MKLIADNQIPFCSLFEQHCTITQLPGDSITQKDLIEADIFLTRSVTTVNAALLKNTAVKFVGNTATGADHIDRQFLSSHHIHYAEAAGANAQTVADYVATCVTALHLSSGLVAVKNQLKFHPIF